MHTNIKTAAKLAAFAGAFALTGCAFVPDTVHPTYTPPANVTKVPGAEKVTVDVVVKNEKKHKDGQISWTKNGYDMDAGGVYMHVSKDFKDAFDKALTQRGFHIGVNSGKTIDVVVHKFFLRETNGWSRISYSGQSDIFIKVTDRKRIKLFSRTFNVEMGKHQVESGFELSGGRHKAVSLFLTYVLNHIFSNSDFIKSLSIQQKEVGVNVPYMNN